jgi:hypothetical protein
MDKRTSGLYATTGMIRAEALRILTNGKFSFRIRTFLLSEPITNGYWLGRFMKNKRLTIRRITTSCCESLFIYNDPLTRQLVASRVNICKNHPYWNLGGPQIVSGPFFSDSSNKNTLVANFSAQTDLF